MTGLAFFGGHWLTKNSDIQPYIYDNGGSGYLSLGATSFPTSLDALTNPSATDSVATVSHSGQHSNANDALEALEAKLGMGASTPVVNTVFVGTGTGSSSYSTYATTTSLLTTYATTTNLLATGSTTLQNFTAQNSTTTSATTTNLYASGSATTTTIRANTGTIGSLTVGTCTGCTSGTSNIALFEATTTSNSSFATTTNLTIGDDVMIWAQCVAIVSSDYPAIALYVKPSGTATSSALGIARTGLAATASDTMHLSVFGLYTALATGSHEIYIGSNDANKTYRTQCTANTATGIMYLVIR